MKFIKRLPLDSNDPMSNRFAVLADNRIETSTEVSLQLPRGTKNQRPAVYVNGQIRYNTDAKELEVYNGSSPGTGWEKIRTVRPATITVQTLGLGDYVKTDFGPLRYSTGENYTDTNNPQNIFVYVENVFQLPNTNFTLKAVGLDTVFVSFNEPPPTKTVTAILGYDGYFPPFIN